MGLIVSDYDGTFSTNERDIKINCNLIEKYIMDGNYFLLSSGRPYDSLMRQVIKHNIPYTHIASSDGNFLFDSDGRILQINELSSNVLNIVNDFVDPKLYDSIQYAYPKFNSLSYNSSNSLGSIAFVIQGNNKLNEFIHNYKIIQMEYPNYQYDIYSYRNIHYYMIRPLGISKSTSIEFLRHLLDIQKKKIYTIGDNNNDYEMIRDYNGFMIGDNQDLEKVALKKYDAVYELVSDIKRKKVLKRW